MKKVRCFYFTDFTSPSNSDDSAIGYSYINARTGELTYYSKKNMMDSEGLLSLVNLVYPREKTSRKYASLYNIDGVPTWVVSMLDKNGIFKKLLMLTRRIPIFWQWKIQLIKHCKSTD